MNVSISKPLIENSKNFLDIEEFRYYKIFKYILNDTTFVGWGRKKSGLWAVKMAKIFGKKHLLLEDGFIRSFGLGVEGSPSFSLIKDDVGIYYDATAPSRLENILNSYDFGSDTELMSIAKEAREKIVEYKISKYNCSKDVDLSFLNSSEKKVLIVAQTANDSSIIYGLGDKFSTKEMINDAIKDNLDSKIYIKIHPDTLKGGKDSDIKIEEIPKECEIITENINPIELLQYFDKVYTKTSGMGMEALLLDKEVHCYGLPFYAGWGVTVDKSKCDRRERRLSIDEICAGAYILYTEYRNPYSNTKSDIISTIEYIHKMSERKCPR